MKFLLFAGSCLALALTGSAATDKPLYPTTYELMINGESFVVHLDQAAKLESRDHPGTTYQVALRLALRQRVELNTLAFEYDWPATVTDSQQRSNRTVHVEHELGFSVTLTDLGRAIEAETRAESLNILKDSVAEGLRESKVRKLTVSEPHARKFTGCDAEGVTFRYQDSQDLGHTCMAWLLTGPTFAATCVVQYADKDAEVCLPRIKDTLESVKAMK
jgi:hypothetical protein